MRFRTSAYRPGRHRTETKTETTQHDGRYESRSPACPDYKAPTGLAHHTTLPPGHWTGERAATDILVLARKGRAFRSLDKLLTRHGGPQVLAGSALALAAATNALAQHTDTPRAKLIRTIIR